MCVDRPLWGDLPHPGLCRTASDFGSALESVWPFFAAMGCSRTSKAELVRLDIIKKVSISAIVCTEVCTLHSLRVNQQWREQQLAVMVVR